jgi:hypothetical protein
MSEENAKELGVKAFAMKSLVKSDFAIVVRKGLDFDLSQSNGRICSV